MVCGFRISDWLLFDGVTSFWIAFVLRWIRFLYHNSEKQVKQNEQIIELLSEMKKQN